MSRFIDADLLGRELEKNKIASDWINISEYQFEPYTNYATVTSCIPNSIPIRRYCQCKHCSAPGQVVGELCEYCGQVV